MACSDEEDYDGDWEEAEADGYSKAIARLKEHQNSMAFGDDQVCVCVCCCELPAERCGTKVTQSWGCDGRTSKLMDLAAPGWLLSICRRTLHQDFRTSEDGREGKVVVPLGGPPESRHKLPSRTHEEYSSTGSSPLRSRWNKGRGSGGNSLWRRVG